MKIAPKNRISRVDTVVDQLREFVDRKKLQSGDRLPTEPELIADLGVSRTVLREAVGRLQSMGLLSVQHGRGTFVADRASLSRCAELVRSATLVGPRDWVQLEEFRTAIEIQSARLAAPAAKAEDFVELERLFAEMLDTRKPFMERVRIDFQFHAKIVAMSGNELLRNAFEVIQQFVLVGMVQTAHVPPAPEIGEKLHRAIIEALRSGDPETAERAMRVHMDAVDRAIRRATGAADGK